jgi:hypothetical protein
MNPGIWSPIYGDYLLDVGTAGALSLSESGARSKLPLPIRVIYRCPAWLFSTPFASPLPANVEIIVRR